MALQVIKSAFAAVCLLLSSPSYHHRQFVAQESPLSLLFLQLDTRYDLVTQLLCFCNAMGGLPLKSEVQLFCTAHEVLMLPVSMFPV